jgi:hypothetical protein
LFYFGKRYFDPEIGVWTAVDPAGQDFYVYGYCAGNPIILVDPNGEYWLGAVIGAVIGAYAGGAMANGSFNPGNWDWENPGTYMGMIGGGISGASLGSGIENVLVKSYFSELKHMPKGYWLDAYVSASGGPVAMRNANIEKAYNLGGREPMQSIVEHVASTEGIPGKFAYQEFPGSTRIPETAGGFTPSGSESIIYKEGFRLPNGEFDPTAVVSRISHEGVHQANYMTPTSQMMVNKAEYLAYGKTLLNANALHLSTPVINYNTMQVNTYAQLLNIGF